MGIKNKPLFTIGISFQLVQFIFFAIVLCSLLNWDWLTSEIVTAVIFGFILLIYNIVSIVLMFSSLD